MPLTSALMRGTVERGLDFMIGMDYHLPGIYERGLANAVNALAAIQRVVFEQRGHRLSELLEALRKDGPDAAWRERLAAGPCWGEDDATVDRLATRLLDARERALEAVDALTGPRAHVCCHVVRSLHHLDGRRLGATPDGRRAGAPLSDSIAPPGGCARKGPSALLASVLRVDSVRYYRGGYNLNVTLPGPAGRTEVVRSLVEAFFGSGGQELQINCLSAAVLRHAQREPERFGHLLVRVAGLSARFVDLSTLEQEELIARAEAVGAGC